MTAPIATDIETLADRCGSLAWMCDALFGLEGRWAALLETDAAVVHLATHSRHLGEHADRLRAMLPDSPALRAHERLVPPPGWVDAIDLAEAITTDHDGRLGDAVRLGVLYRGLVPRLAGSVAVARSEASGPGASAVARVLRQLDDDVHGDLAGGSALLAATLGDEQAISAVAEAVSALDRVCMNG